MEESANKLVKFRGVYYPLSYLEYSDTIENFRVRDDDVWIGGFQKAGTTWAREMVWCIVNDLNFKAAEVRIEERCPWLECEAAYRWNDILKKHPDLKVPKCVTNSVEFADKLSSPRLLRTSLPFHILPRDLREGRSKAKIIYVTRDPKDTCVSYFHYRKNSYGSAIKFDDFSTHFLEGQCFNGSFWEHVLGYLNERERWRDRLLIVKYSDMKFNLRKVIEEVSKFLGKPILSSEDSEKLIDHLSFERMKNNPAVNRVEWMKNHNVWNNHKREEEFMRSGAVGQWKSVMSAEISKKFDERTVSAFESINFNF